MKLEKLPTIKGRRLGSPPAVYTNVGRTASFPFLFALFSNMQLYVM